MSNRGDDRGAAIVEAALVLPLFLTAILGLIDLGYAVFQTTQASSAARDGARAAILAYSHADVVGSSDNDRVVSEVRGRLAGQAVQSITVSCLRGQSGSTTVACADATPDADRIRVVVRWSYAPLTPAGAAVGTITISGTATMGILGSPIALPPPTTMATTTTSTTSTTSTTAPSSSSTSTTTTTVPSTTTTTTTVPGSCAVTSLNINPSPIDAKNNGALGSDTVFTVTTNGAATCTNLKIQYPTSPAVTRGLLSGGSNTWTDTVSKNSLNWVTGTNLPVNVLSGATVLPGGAFTVSVV